MARDLRRRVLRVSTFGLDPKVARFTKPDRHHHANDRMIPKLRADELYEGIRGAVIAGADPTCPAEQRMILAITVQRAAAELVRRLHEERGLRRVEIVYEPRPRPWAL